MKVTYIYHSCFVVELEHSILLFDYYKGDLPAFDPHKTLYVFVSHHHEDHFNPLIFTIPHPNRMYVLSDDVQPISDVKKCYFVRAHHQYHMEDLSLQTLQSTDEGVAFVIFLENETIYHAGDLNWWDWGEEDTPQEASDMRIAYQSEITLIKDIKCDVAFVPLDGRLQKNFYKGMDYFMRHTKTKIVFPMHMANSMHVIADLIHLPQSQPYRSRIVRIVKYPQVWNHVELGL